MYALNLQTSLKLLQITSCSNKFIWQINILNIALIFSVYFLVILAHVPYAWNYYLSPFDFMFNLCFPYFPYFISMLYPCMLFLAFLNTLVSWFIFLPVLFCLPSVLVPPLLLLILYSMNVSPLFQSNLSISWNQLCFLATMEIIFSWQNWLFL